MHTYVTNISYGTGLAFGCVEGLSVRALTQASSASSKLPRSATLGRDIAVPRAWFWRLVQVLLFLATRNTPLPLPIRVVMSLCVSGTRRWPVTGCQRGPVTCPLSLFVLWGHGGRLKWLLLPLSPERSCYVTVYLTKPLWLARSVTLLSIWRFVL